MTREEAKKLVDARRDGSTESLLALWEQLGVIKFDDPKTVVQDLLAKLRNLKVEIEWRSRDKDSDTISGRLTVYGAGCIIAFIQQNGFEVVRK